MGWEGRDVVREDLAGAGTVGEAQWETDECGRNGGGGIGPFLPERSLVKSRCPSPGRRTEEAVLELGGPPPPPGRLGGQSPG